MQAAHDGDRDAAEVVERWAERLGIGVANAINTFDPEEVVIGGGAAQAGELLLAPVRRVAAEYVLPGLRGRRRSGSARHGVRAGVSGAALLAAHELEDSEAASSGSAAGLGVSCQSGVSCRRSGAWLTGCSSPATARRSGACPASTRARTDLPLTVHGREQARAVRDKLVGQRFSLVLCSPLHRAVETATLAGVGERIELCDDLQEWDYGDYEGLTTPQIRERNPSWDLWHDGCPGGESPDEVGARLDRVLARVAGVEGDALAFAHGHALRVLTARWLEMEVAAGARFKLAAAALGVLGHERETQALDRWSV